jgi:branched-chain amino acid aminotransferase
MAAFGTEFTQKMVTSDYRDGQWSDLAVVPVAPFTVHPATHVLHYASECFEGLKAYRTGTGKVHLFRPDRHIARMTNSAAQLLLEVPDQATLSRSLHMAVAAVVDEIPHYPGRTVPASHPVWRRRGYRCRCPAFQQGQLFRPHLAGG